MGLIGAPYVGPPKSYTKGRVRPLQGIAWHCTEGSEGPQSAEAGVAYDKRRADGTSTHEFADSNGALMTVRAADRAHTLRYHGNEIFYSIEICASAGQTPAQWADATSRATLDVVAQRTAALFIEQGWPVERLVRLSVAQTRAAYYGPAGQRPVGVVGHVDVTKAFPEDQGSHWDPGPNFPWDATLAAARAYMLANTGPALIESEAAMRFTFQGFPDEADYNPATPGGPSRVHVTDGVRHRVQQYGKSIDALVATAGAGPVVNITPTNSGLKTYAIAAAAFCGSRDPGEQAGGSGSDHTRAVSVSVSGSGSGTTGPARPAE